MHRKLRAIGREHAQRYALQIIRIEAGACDEPVPQTTFDSKGLIARYRNRHARPFAGERLQHRVAAVRDHKPRTANELDEHGNRQAWGNFELVRMRCEALALRRHADQNGRIGLKCNATRRLGHDLRRAKRSGMARTAARHHEHVLSLANPEARHC